MTASIIIGLDLQFGGNFSNLAIHVLGYGCLIAGAAIYANNIDDEYNYRGKLEKDNSGKRNVGIALISSASAICLGGTIGGCIRPWRYANEYNKNLTSALNGKKVSVNFAPVIDPIGKNYGLLATLSF